MRSRSFAFAFVLTACIAGPCLSTGTARAQDDATTQVARERFQEGVAYYDQKQYEKARAAFLQAYALKKHPAVLLNLAQSELRSNHPGDAAKHFSEYLRKSKDATAAERQEAELGLAAATSKAGQVTVTIDQQGAEVFVDDELEGRAPLPGPIYLDPGQHTIEARLGEQVASQQVNAAAGQKSSISLTLAAAAGPATAPPTGPATGGTTPPPTGAPVGSGTPPPGEDTGTGFQVDTSSPRQGFIPWAKENKLAWVGGGLTALGLIGGFTFAITSKFAYDDADSVLDKIKDQADEENRQVAGLCNPPPNAQYAQACAKYQDNVDAGDTQKTLSIVSFVVAGVAAGGTVAYYFIDTGKKKSSGANELPSSGVRAAFVPVLSPEQQGLGVIGQF